MWHCPQCPQCPPGYCCHLLAGPNPAQVLSPATAPRPGGPPCDPTILRPTPVAPRMAPGWIPQGVLPASLLRARGSQAPKPLTASPRGTAGCHPVLTCSLGCRLLPHRPPPHAQTPPHSARPLPPPYCVPFTSGAPARGLGIVQFVLADAGNRIRPSVSSRVRAAAPLGLVSPGSIRLRFSPRLPSGRGSSPEIAGFPRQSGLLGLTGLRKFAESHRPRDRRAHTEPLPTAPLPSPAFPASPLPLGPAGPCWG